MTVSTPVRRRRLARYCFRAARLAAVRAAWREKQRLSGEWIKTVPKTDYAAIVECLRALRRGKEAGG